ncbi:fimbrillin family protein [Bacteroides hominis]|uniref:fimbrillin family protein n=1 Tax=Bacteroides TaxID=816 RepID=UPI00345A17ED
MKAYKNRYLITGRMTVLLTSLLLFSCNNDDFLDNDSDSNIGKYSDHICFDISGTESPLTRGIVGTGKVKEEHTTGRFVLRSANTPDTLCVRATVSDGIDCSSFSGETPVTRSAPVNSLEEYGTFHVQAHCKEDGTLVNTFYMDDNVTYRNNNWSTDNVYYWPGATRTLQFFAWAPIDAELAIPEAPGNTTLTYTVPAAVSEQKDLVVAKTDEIEGNKNEVIPLAFEHICTAVRFVTGSQMHPGTIKSVALKGVRYKGSYDLENGKWTLNDDANDFTQSLDKKMSGNETDGTEVSAGEGTFMMLPQTLPTGAKVEVVFADGVTGENRTLEAPVAGMEWPQGKTVTYKLSISPEYEFKLENENPVLDAHYDILLTKLIVSDVPAGKTWTVTAPTLNDEKVTIQKQDNMNSYAKQGYWTANYAHGTTSGKLEITGSARGETVYQGTGSGEFPIAVFVPENIGDASRTVELSVRLDDSDDIVQTLTISQLAPAWYGNGIGCERIEGEKVPWGFSWDSDFKLIYDLTSCDNDDSRESIRQYVEWTKALKALGDSWLLGWLIHAIFGDDIPDLSFVDMEKSGDVIGLGGKADKITINLGSLSTSGVAESMTDGQKNTREVYNFNGIQFVNEIINRIQNIPGYQVATEGKGVFPTNNASIACMKLNSWDIIEANNEYILSLTGGSEVMDPKWYLPATEEVAGINDTEYPLEGEYWTSTAVKDDNQYAYKHSDGSTSSKLRSRELSVRAVRKKP